MTVHERDILDALLDVFAERGCFNTSVDAVAASVGIGKGSVYRHFESREALCQAALAHGASGLVSHCRQVWEAEPDRPPEARLLAVVTELVALNERADPQSPDTLLRLSCSNRWTGAGQASEALTSAFVLLVRDWQAAGLCGRGEDPRWIAAVLLGLVSSLPLTVRAGADGSDQTAIRLVRLLRRGFAAESGAGGPSTPIRAPRANVEG